MNNKIKIILASSVLLSSLSVLSQENLLSDKDLVKSDKIWVENQENYLAQFYIAENHYLKGDFGKALNWYLRSAEQGFDSAITNSIIMIEKDLGTKNNMDEVVNFLTKKGLDGDVFSQMYLGDIYRDGKYQKNLEKSYFWYSEASKQGVDRANLYVGNMSVAGVGAPQNIPKGIRYLESSAENGSIGAMYNLGKIYKVGFNISKNHEKASYWFDIAAKKGNVDSMYEIADSIELGFGVDRDMELAFDWFKKAALHGHSKAAYRAGNLKLQLSIISDEHHYDEAIQLLEVASDEDIVDATVKLGDIYYEGAFVEKNYIKAIEYYNKATTQGSKLAWEKISMIYRFGGFGVEKSTDKYKEAIKKFYTIEKHKIKRTSDKLKLFNYNIFE